METAKTAGDTYTGYKTTYSQRKRIRSVIHNRKQILFLDFSGCSAKESLETIDEAKRLIKEQPPNSVLTLTNVQGARYNQEVTLAFKECAKSNTPFVKAGAVVGLDELKKIIYNAIMLFSERNLRAFTDIEKAKDWLTEQ